MRKTKTFQALLSFLIAIALIASLAVGVMGCGDDDDEDGDGLPGKGVTVNPARAGWSTGYFHSEIYIKALEELGYNVKRPVELQNPAFYTALAGGELDYWPNGWFPLHNTQFNKYQDKISKVGYVAKGGALEGYLIDKKTAEEYDITNLEQFLDPEIAEIFDNDGDGKAELVACPPGWGCEETIAHHLDAYELRDTVDPIKVDYAIGMAEAVGNYQNGEPIFFYTWTPNWTVNRLVPGEDVVWIEVPFSSLPESQKDLEDATIMEGVEGCVSDPCNMGFPANDIRVAANNDFLDKNPAAKKLFEVASVPLEDIFAQNDLMYEGENSDEEVIGHAEEWIENNRATFDSWIDQALAAAE
ncbi:MAG: glycine betaine/L-proline ABC transporter substrate-binding protein ProX [Dehalococcoidia bacterium]